MSIPCGTCTRKRISNTLSVPSKDRTTNESTARFTKNIVPQKVTGKYLLIGSIIRIRTIVSVLTATVTVTTIPRLLTHTPNLQGS